MYIVYVLKYRNTKGNDEYVNDVKENLSILLHVITFHLRIT